MTRYLSTSLGQDPNVFADKIAKLEQATLQTGVDIRLTTLIRQAVKAKISELHLDPNDTTAEELFVSLKLLARQGDANLKSQLGIHDDASSVQILQSVARFMSADLSSQKVWSIKRSVLKKIFAAHPPLKTMKVLKYRSQASMLKREPVAELYALIHLLEGDQYLHKVRSAFKKLHPSDFEEHALEVICFDTKRWKQISGFIKKRTVPVFALAELSLLVVIPIDTLNTRCLALLSAALMLQEARQIKAHTSYLKLKTLDPKLHLHVQTIAEHGHIPVFTVHNEQVYWHHVFHVLSTKQNVPEGLEPHISQEDLDWLHIEAKLAAIEPSLSFWIDSHRLIFATETQGVSMHIIDIALAEMFGTPLDQLQNTFAKKIILDELLEAYIQLPPFNRYIDEYIYKIADEETEMLYA